MEHTEKHVSDFFSRQRKWRLCSDSPGGVKCPGAIEKASQTKGTVTGIPTGFVDLDYKTSGLQPSDFILVAARPSMGKTAFVLNIAQYTAFRKDKSVAIFSLEMSKEQLVNPYDGDGIYGRFTIIRTGSLQDNRLGENDGKSGNDWKFSIDH